MKQRALELSSPRPLESISSLADFSQLPSDTLYVNSVEGAVGSATDKKCSLCDARVCVVVHKCFASLEELAQQLC